MIESDRQPGNVQENEGLALSEQIVNGFNPLIHGPASGITSTPRAWAHLHGVLELERSFLHSAS